jgi:phosphopantetheine--protein transferase-like protein
VVEGLGDDVHVSITHQEGRAVAIAARGAPLGVDLETIAPRDPAFARTWFTEDEEARWGHDPANATRVWALKEATLKALGRGMALSPREVEVLALAGTGARLHLHGDAARGLALLGHARLHAEVADVDDVRVLATVVLAA